MNPRIGLPSGMTLLELVVAIALVGIIVASLPLVLDGALGMRERAALELRLEREIAALADAWAHDTAAAHAAHPVADGCVLDQSGREVRFRNDAGAVWRETRATAVPTWTPFPMRPLARLAPGETLTFQPGPGTLTLAVAAPSGTWSRTAAFRRSSP